LKRNKWCSKSARGSALFRSAISPHSIDLPSPTAQGMAQQSRADTIQPWLNQAKNQTVLF
jgi:hypothetical protein